MLKDIDWFDLTNSYIQLNDEGFNEIISNIRDKSLSFREIQRKTGLSHTNINEFLKFKRAIKCVNLLKLIDFLNIDREYFRKFVYCIHSNPYKEFSYKFNFPIRITPLHIRLISHFIGDGALEKHGCRWYQKSDVGGSYIKKLIYDLTCKDIEKGKKDSYGIPIILADLVCIFLNIKRNEIKTNKFLGAILNLPDEYKLQFLAALIVDEGSIGKSSIKISNTNKELLKGTKQVLESLKISCSDIKISNAFAGKEIFIKGHKTKANYDSLTLYIHADGLFKFDNYIKTMIESYGNVCGLWHKQKKLQECAYKINPNLSKDVRFSKNYLIPLIKSEIENKPLKVSEFASEYGLDYFRTYKIFHRLKERNLINKIGIGTFASINYNGPLLESLADKIKKELYNRKLVRVVDLATSLNADCKSVSNQLRSFVRNDLAIKIKRGYYSSI